MKRILTGIKPSGELTLGSLIGGINQMIKHQDEYESFIFVPDMHAITVPQEKKELKSRIKKSVELYLACGINPDKNIIYLQSENLFHANLSWIFECNTYFGEASRMTQFKDKYAKGENISVGMFTYPMLMAADILLYDADFVPVGIDQKQHVELTRDIATRFNNKYGETFKVPTPIIPQIGAKIMDLQEPTKKMSKSDKTDKGCIYLLDDPNIAKKKIKSAVTDSEAIIKYDPEKKPGISNLLTIYAVIKMISIKETEELFKECNYGELKETVGETVKELLISIQNKYKQIQESNLYNEVLDKGKEVTNKIAFKKVMKVYHKIGLER